MRRKIFRIEQSLRARPSHSARPESAARPSASNAKPDDARRELEALYKAIHQGLLELSVLRDPAGGSSPISRASRELAAAVDAMEHATQRILKSAEAADETARTLSASLKKDYERSLARDVQDSVTEIFEACNFQDMAGQRIGKAIAVMKLVEERLQRLFDISSGLERIERDAVAPRDDRLVNGPRLEGDAGHVSQNEIDRMFG